MRATIRFVRDKAVPLTIRGGGHGVSGKAVMDDAVMMDLSPMRGLQIDPLNQRAVAQAGLTWVTKFTKRLLSRFPWRAPKQCSAIFSCMTAGLSSQRTWMAPRDKGLVKFIRSSIQSGQNPGSDECLLFNAIYPSGYTHSK